MTRGLEWLDNQTGEVLYRLEWDLLGRMVLMPKGSELMIGMVGSVRGTTGYRAAESGVAVVGFHW